MIFHSFFKRGIGIYNNFFIKLLGRYGEAGQAGWGEKKVLGRNKDGQSD